MSCAGLAGGLSGLKNEGGGMKVRHIVNVSGGKDSTATLLLAIDRLGADGFEAVFADTDHEHPFTYAYLDYLEERLSIRIRRIKADFTDKLAFKKSRLRERWAAEGIDEDIITRAEQALVPSGNAFLDICKLQSGFPSLFSRFCTDYLKIRPIHEQVIDPCFWEGFHVIQWLGVRRDESPARAKTPLYFIDRFYGRTQAERNALVFTRRKGKAVIKRVAKFYPIRDWTVADVLRFIADKQVKLNLLYAAGTRRVGCAPCIFARNAEVELLLRNPVLGKRLEEWDAEVNKVSKQHRRVSSFFGVDRVPGLRARYEAGGEPPTVEEVRDYLRRAEPEKQTAMDFAGCEAGWCDG